MTTLVKKNHSPFFKLVNIKIANLHDSAFLTHINRTFTTWKYRYFEFQWRWNFSNIQLISSMSTIEGRIHSHESQSRQHQQCQFLLRPSGHILNSLLPLGRCGETPSFIDYDDLMGSQTAAPHCRRGLELWPIPQEDQFLMEVSERSIYPSKVRWLQLQRICDILIFQLNLISIC